MRRTLFLGLALIVGCIAPVQGQTPAIDVDLLARVPKHFGMCLVVNDLRGHAQRLTAAPWWQTLQQSPLGKSLNAAPELQDLAKFERELKRHLGIDWITFRDDLLGDQVVLAYRPAVKTPAADEQGLFMVRARRAEKLMDAIDRLNDLQRKAGELKALESREHKGIAYFRREHVKNTLWYAVQGQVFTFASSEDVLKDVLEPSESPAPVRQALRRAEAERSLAAVWLNPRAFDAELAGKVEQSAGPDGLVLKAVLEHWRALDGVVLSLDVRTEMEVRLTLLAQSGPLPASAKAWFSRSGRASELWGRFPAESILIAAGQTHFRGLADGILELAPREVRQGFVESVGKNVGAALGLDPFQDVLPNLGPDFGICVLPAAYGREFPQALIAVAVKPGDKEVAVDQALFRSIQFFVGLALFEHNRTQPESKRIRMRTVQQGGVEVKFLEHDGFFPVGLKPACALKDGYLVLATSPSALERFQRQAAPSPAHEETPLLFLAPDQLAQLIRLHRHRILAYMSEKNGQPKAATTETLDGLLSLLDLSRGVTLSLRADETRLAWVFRLQMSKGNSVLPER